MKDYGELGGQSPVQIPPAAALEIDLLSLDQRESFGQQAGGGVNQPNHLVRNEK